MAKRLFKPPVRDTTVNSSREILARVGTVVLLGGIIGVPLLIISARENHSLPHFAGAIGLAVFAAAAGYVVRRERLARTRFTPSPTPHPAAAALKPMAPHRPRIVVLNASLAGPAGNSARALEHLTPHLAAQAELLLVELAGPDARAFAQLEPALRNADAIVIATGTHWDSWSSALQRFLEDATPSEGSALWLGKPVAIIVSEHSTGGKGVLSRLQGVLVTFGCTIPPMSGVVLSQAAHLATRHSPTSEAGPADFWSLHDLPMVAANLLTAARVRLPASAWQAWPVDHTATHDRWLN